MCMPAAGFWNRIGRGSRFAVSLAWLAAGWAVAVGALGVGAVGALGEERPEGAPRAGEVNVREVRIEGNATTPKHKLPKLSTRAGQPFDPRVLDEDVRALDRTRKFIDVRPKYQRTPEGLIVIFQVVERPTLAEVKYVGNKGIRSKTLAKQGEIKAGDALDIHAIEDARRRVEQYYLDHGYAKAKVTTMEGNKPGDRRAVFLINEGTKQRVFWTDFVGNTIADDARLRTQIQAKPGVLWFIGGYVDHKKIDEDLDRLTAYYRSLGFFQAKIGRELQYDEDQEWLNITYVINEGPRYSVRNVSVIGNEKFTSEEIDKLLKLRGGQFFDQNKLQADVAAIRDLYGGQGHIFSDVQSDVRFDEAAAQLDLVYDISEGKVYRVGRINVQIAGENPHTRQRTVLNRLSLRSGDIVDTRLIRADEARLKRSGLFMNDPAKGAVPKIAIVPPAGLSEEELAASKKRKPSSRFQSPDSAGPTASGSREPAGGNRKSQPVEVEEIDLVVTGAPDPRGAWEGGDRTHERRHEQTGKGRAWPAERKAGEEHGRDPGVRMQSPDASGLRWGGPRVASGAQTAANEASRARFQGEGGARGVQRAGYEAALGEPSRGVGTAARYDAPVGNAAGPIGSTSWGLNPDRGPIRDSQVAQAQFQGGVAPPGAGPVNYPPPGGPAVGGGVFGGPPVPQGPAYAPGVVPEFVPPGAVGAPGGIAPPPGAVGYEVFPEYVDLNSEVTEAQTGRLMFGVGVNSNAGVIGNIVLDEQNFDISRFPTSWEDFRNGTAWRGAGQRLRLEAAPGSQVSRYSASFTEPYLFDSPISLGLSGFYYQRFFQDWTEERTGGRVSLGYVFPYRPDLSINTAFRYENVVISDPRVPTPPELARAVGSNDLIGFSVGLTHDTRDSPFLATEGFLMQYNFEQVVGSFNYPRFTMDARRYFTLNQRPDGSGRRVLSLSGTFGITGDDTPIYDNFFAGGFSTLRGFRFRGASPRSGNVIVGGQLELLGSVEYMFPITADDMLRGVVFCDFGTVEQDIDLNSENFRAAPGFGMRITVPALGPAPIAFDFAFPVAEAPGDQNQVFIFFVGLNR